MKNLVQPGFLFLALCPSLLLHAQTPDIIWKKCFGGSNIDAAYSADLTTDGGYIIAGGALSSDGDVTVNKGSFDYWIVKSDVSADLQWQKSLGGSGEEAAYSIQQTTDGGYIVAGYSYSNDGDVSGNHGGSDYWILKLNAAGDVEWQKCLGGSADDVASSIQQTSDGGFIVAGYSSSNDWDVTANYGLSDYWIVKLDGDGNISWQKSLGGVNDDQGASIQEISGGGFIVAGWSGVIGAADYWIINLDADGNIVWEKSYGGTGNDQATSVRQTNDGGFIVAGHSYSTDSNITNQGGADYWVVKLDAAGNLTWQKSFGGSDEDVANAIQQTSDGGFIVAGKSESDNGDVSPLYDKHDFWIVKLSAAGSLLWQKSLGGDKDDVAFSIHQTSDNGFMVAGWSISTDGDIIGSEPNGSRDFWVVKLSSDIESGIASLTNSSISVYPNPVQNELIINLTIPVHKVRMQVCDLQGRTISIPNNFPNSSTAQNNTVKINTAELSNGFYTLRITDEKTGESKVTKFVKMQ